MPDVITRFLDRSDAMLARLDEQLRQAEGVQEAAVILCEYTGRELNLADCVVYLPTGAGGLVRAATWGPRRGADRAVESRIRLSIGTGVVGDCARQLRTQRVDDTREDPRYAHDPEPGLSELTTPITLDGILLGVLDSEDADPAFYDARYERAFEAIADCSAVHLWRLRRETVGGGHVPAS